MCNFQPRLCRVHILVVPRVVLLKTIFFLSLMCRASMSCILYRCQTAYLVSWSPLSGLSLHPAWASARHPLSLSPAVPVSVYYHYQNIICQKKGAKTNIKYYVFNWYRCSSNIMFKLLKKEVLSLRSTGISNKTGSIRRR